MKTLTKEEAAEELAHYDYDVDKDTRAIYRVTSANEDAPNEPLKLLKVNADRKPVGVMPLHFPPHVAGGILFSYEIAVVTLEEFAQIQRGDLLLPEDWQISSLIGKRDRRERKPQLQTAA